MAFWHHLPVPELDYSTKNGPKPSDVRIVRWLMNEGADVHAGIEIAIIEIESVRYAVLANGDGSLREKLFPEKASIPFSSPMATINSDGESIPYGKAYSIARRIVA
jgi:pyruvate/2-oxoglutarate dehydrogenase complex dihydrolipoamide acyltransferase (E2) component